MKKRMFVFAILFLIFMIPNVKAASGSYKITSNKSTAVVGSTISVTVRFSSSVPIGGWEFTVKYDTDILSLTDGESYVVDTPSNKNQYSVSYSYSFKVKKSGNAKIYLSGVEIQDWDTKVISMSGGSTTVKCMTQAEIEASYSKNNNLSGLSIDGYELSPSFSADTTEYTAEIKAETESIHINASKADSTASVTGAGDIAVSDGPNTIKIDVTAQNGNVKTYTITATVLELDPINVKVGDVDYTVVRSKKALTFNNSLFTETTTQVNGIDVPAFYNEITNTTLIGLKDSNGIIKYFEVTDDGYTEYKELIFGTLNIMLVDATDIPDGYYEKDVTINEVTYPAYVSADDSEFYLIYGTNLSTGTTSFYSYDSIENSLSRADTKNLELDQAKIKKYKLETYILGGTTILFFISLVITLISKIKGNKNTKNKIDNLKKEIYPEEKEESDINNIIDDDDNILDKIETKIVEEPEQEVVDDTDMPEIIHEGKKKHKKR